MDNSENDFLIDRQTLGQFVDELIKNHTIPVNTPEELTAFREKAMHELDDRIGEALFGGLTEAQGAELDALLDADNDSPEPYQAFFAKHGIDVEKITTETAKKYVQDFVGGKNA